jgi:hypothetical protein
MSDGATMIESSTSLKVAVVCFAGALGVLIAFASLTFLLRAESWSTHKDVFELTVTRTLLPLFSTMVTAVLAYIFGKTFVALAEARLHTHRDRSQ